MLRMLVKQSPVQHAHQANPSFKNDVRRGYTGRGSVDLSGQESAMGKLQ